MRCSPNARGAAARSKSTPRPPARPTDIKAWTSQSASFTQRVRDCADATPRARRDHGIDGDRQRPVARRRRRESDMNDDELVGHVTDELAWDPKIDGEAVAVSADDGTVMLRGTVGSLREKLEARKAAERVHGVHKVR